MIDRFSRSKMRRFKKLNILLFVTITLLVSFSCTLQGKAKQIEIDTLVIPSRNHTRIQPEIFYAFKTTANKIEPLLKMRFILFNPFQDKVIEDSLELEEKFMDLLNECVVETVVIKKVKPQTEELLKDIHDYIRINPGSHLAQFHVKIEEIMEEFEFLIIESSDTYGIHPMFYIPNVIQVDTPEGANAKDIIETLYGLFFIDAAFKQNKPVWGTCHGAQIGYVHAGGKLGRLFEYKENGYDVDLKKSGQKSAEEEIWHIEKMLYTQSKDADHIEYNLAAYPVPEIFKDQKRQDKEMYMNKDFDHSFAMIKPIPERIRVISCHPLSKYKEKVTDEKYEEFNKEFKKIFKNQVIIDVYKYRTMLGTQYHPQYTYDDLETSVVFDYLVKQLVNCDK